jgi:hypothetical protein
MSRVRISAPRLKRPVGSTAQSTLLLDGTFDKRLDTSAGWSVSAERAMWPDLGSPVPCRGERCQPARLHVKSTSGSGRLRLTTFRPRSRPSSARRDWSRAAHIQRSGFVAERRRARFVGVPASQLPPGIGSYYDATPLSGGCQVGKKKDPSSNRSPRPVSELPGNVRGPAAPPEPSNVGAPRAHRTLSLRRLGLLRS